jgi:AAA15 family ATPase/GTPase
LPKYFLEISHMTNHTSNKIKRLELENFTCFSKAAFDFSPGINVFIGENGTGKTHVLKVLYSLSLDKQHDPLPLVNGERNFMLNAAYNLIEIFKPDKNDLFRLVRYNEEIGGNIKIVYGEDQQFNFRITKLSNSIGAGAEKDFNIPLQKSLYIPPLEILSWYRGFVASYEKRENSVDATYYYLAKSLSLLPLKGEGKEFAISFGKKLANETNIQSVNQTGDQFFVKFEGSNFEVEAQLIAQGINKIAEILYLILNGSLTKDTILFWDEPEANLNPKYITLVAKFLQTLANAGCQIFVASHDYLLVHELSLLSEYREEKEMNGETVPDIKFFALYKGEDGSTQVEEGQSMSEIQNDAIGEEYAAHHNREEALWRKPYEKTSL